MRGGCPAGEKHECPGHEKCPRPAFFLRRHYRQLSPQPCWLPPPNSRRTPVSYCFGGFRADYLVFFGWVGQNTWLAKFWGRLPGHRPIVGQITWASQNDGQITWAWANCCPARFLAFAPLLVSVCLKLECAKTETEARSTHGPEGIMFSVKPRDEMNCRRQVHPRQHHLDSQPCQSSRACFQWENAALQPSEWPEITAMDSQP